MVEPLVDGHGRLIRDLRVSVTDRCNFRCQYCMPAEGLPWLEREEILSFEEIERLVRVFVGMGVEDLRLTGGEPLVRREFPKLLGMLARIDGLQDISLTTNGYLLERDAGALVAAGLRRINVSIDTLQRDRFFHLTRRDALPQVLRGLDAIARHPQVRPIKVNAVALRGFTEQEALPLAELARETGFQVRFIEFMPLDADRAWSEDAVLTGDEVRAIVERVHPLEELPREPSATARVFRFRDGAGEIGFVNPVSEPFCSDCRARDRGLEIWDSILRGQQWSEGQWVTAFEEAWSAWSALPSVAFGSWAGGALAALEFAGVKGETVLCPSNTFMATPLTVLQAGGEVQFVDCNREDLCMSFEDFERKVDEHRPRAAWLVHIGGHIAFDSERIAELCRAEGIFLIEDCAHAHGASWDGRKPGAYGDAGIYSFYATKTVSTGEGGVLVSRNEDLLDYARGFRNYGKPDYTVPGLNFRMSEFTAALAAVQTERLDEIVAWKNAVARERLDSRYERRLELPDGMTSGLYKYVVFEPIQRSTGKVYDEPCHRLMGHQVEMPNSDWVAENHWCVPLYYRPAGPAGGDSS